MNYYVVHCSTVDECGKVREQYSRENADDWKILSHLYYCHHLIDLLTDYGIHCGKLLVKRDVNQKEKNQLNIVVIVQQSTLPTANQLNHEVHEVVKGVTDLYNCVLCTVI